MRYAEIIVDLSAEAVDRVFTYSVPDEMAADVGWQVAVPFGNRTLEGFIIALKDEPGIPSDKVKPVLNAVRDYPVILPELISLAKWMHERYLCNLVDALRLMIPSQMRGDRVHERTVRMAHLRMTEAEVEAFIAGNARAKAQCALVKALLKGDLECPALPKAPLKALVDKGLVEIVREEVRRTPASLRVAADSADPELMPDQRRALDTLLGAMDAGGRFLLHGVTGSGKTEVYIRVIREALARGRSAIVLVPEIALTPQMVSWFHARFGGDAAVLHSGLSAGERYDEWRRIRTGEARVVIGARSAVFAPLEDIGVIVVDEEHESTYQSDRRPRYDAREVAWRRAEAHKAVLILGSATPSLSTYMRAMPGVRPENRLHLLEMRGRVRGRPLPPVELVDMRVEFQRGNQTIFSAKLREALARTLSEGRQAILFLNRRGYATFVSCRACGKVVKCSQCDVSMTYHRDTDRLVCHYCGREMAPPKTCPECGSRYIKYFGAGTQKVEEEVRRLFPDARTVRMDVDTTQGKDAHEALLARFRSGECNVLIGTQMIAKGHDFPHVTLVGVIAADMTLNLPDYRASERTFQLITQVAGRAGRADEPGRVIVQTYDPDHYSIQLSAKQDYRAFYGMESAYRRKALYPPFTVIARIVYSSRDPMACRNAAEQAEQELNGFLDTHDQRPDVIQMRALEAPIKLLRGLTRWQVFLKMYFKGDTETVTKEMQALAERAPEGVRAELEVNPTNLF
ncbi:MAG: primosomal protein N' [Clostridiales bacterium]|nr:primosomal protein N' [Clostridiales bacterium]